MNIEIRNVRDVGNIDSERIVLKVGPENDDIGKYILLDTELAKDQQPTNRLRHTFWFPDKKIRANDIVVLYTKPGRAGQKENGSGSISHFFYWGLQNPIWNGDSNCAVILRVKDWEYLPVGKLSAAKS
jgi:hypothetical protein